VRFAVESAIHAAKRSGDPTLRMAVAIYHVARRYYENRSPYIAEVGSSLDL